MFAGCRGSLLADHSGAVRDLLEEVMAALAVSDAAFRG
jgi:hypothetical protein